MNDRTDLETTTRLRDALKQSVIDGLIQSVAPTLKDDAGNFLRELLERDVKIGDDGTTFVREMDGADYFRQRDPSERVRELMERHPYVRRDAPDADSDVPKAGNAADKPKKSATSKVAVAESTARTDWHAQFHAAKPKAEVSAEHAELLEQLRILAQDPRLNLLAAYSIARRRVLEGHGETVPWTRLLGGLK